MLRFRCNEYKYTKFNVPCKNYFLSIEKQDKKVLKICVVKDQWHKKYELLETVKLFFFGFVMKINTKKQNKLNQYSQLN